MVLLLNQWHIWNLVKHIRDSVFSKKSSKKAKTSITDVQLGSKYVSMNINLDLTFIRRT